MYGLERSVFRQKLYFSRPKNFMANSFSSNVLANGILQLLNYVFPLVALPFLTWVLSPESFGAINYFSFLVGYFSLFVVFGLEYSGTREVVRKVHAGEDLNEYYSRVMSAKLHLLVLASAVYFVLLCLLPTVDHFWPIALSTYTITFGFSLSPVWLFMGLKRMREIILVHALPKIALLASIFYFIQTDSDAYYYPLALGLSTILGHGMSWILVRTKAGIRFSWKPWSKCKNVISGGRFAFGVTALAVMVQTGGIIVLERFTDFAVVGGFSLGWRLINIIQVLIMVPVYQALFPMIGENLAAKTWTVRETVRHVTPRIIGLLASMIGIGYFTLPCLLAMFFDSQYEWSFMVFASLIPFAFLNAMNQLLGVQILLHLGFDRLVFYAYLWGLGLMLLACWIFIPQFGWVGTSMALCSAELFLLVAFISVTKRFNLYT